MSSHLPAQIAIARPGITLLPTRGALPESDAELQQMPFYHVVMEPQGWRHAVALCFWDDPPSEVPMFILTVYRRPGRPDFSDNDMARLERFHRFVDPAIRRLHERSRRDGTPRCDDDSDSCGNTRLDRARPARLRVVRSNPAARQLCASWSQTQTPDRRVARSHVSVPKAILDECRALRHEWELMLRESPDAHVVRRRQLADAIAPHLSASITMVCHSPTALAEPSFVVELDRSPLATTEQRASSLLRRLTGAERDVVAILMDGSSNQEIADGLGKSVHAVKFLLHRIYRKADVPNRARLIAMLRGEPLARA